MDRYLLQLQSDIRHAAASAPEMEEVEPFANLDDEEPIYEPASLRFSLPDLLGIPFEAFPPSSFLTDKHMEVLVGEIAKLWGAWRLYWDMPPDLSFAQQYSAMLRAMKEEIVSWQLNVGGTLKICHYETKGFCPHGDNGHCYCKMLNEAAQQDLEAWEEHVRSQGIDPYEDLTEEAGAAFQAESKRRAFLKQNEEEWSDLWPHEGIKIHDTTPTPPVNEILDYEEYDAWFGLIISNEDSINDTKEPSTKAGLNDSSNDLFNEDFFEMNT